MRSERGASIFDKLLRRRKIAVAVLLLFTGVLGWFAARVKADYAVEMMFPTFHQSRTDYDRFKKEFPFEDAHALVIVEAPDLFTPAGLRRLTALEQDLVKIPGVTDTTGLSTVKDFVARDGSISLEKVFPGPELSAEDFEKQKRIVTTDPLLAWNIAPPDGRATTLRVTLTREEAGKDEHRTRFLHRAREVISRHEALAEQAGVKQKIVLNGLPVIRSEFTELINRDVQRLMPVAMTVILILLYLTFRTVKDSAAALITILTSIVWTHGAMGLMGVPIQILTQITPIVVMIISISDTVHIISHYKSARLKGMGVDAAVVDSLSDSALPCLLTELTIAGGFVALILNDMLMIQQFGMVTAVGMLLTWLANVTVLPLALAWLKPEVKVTQAAGEKGISAALTRGLIKIEGLVLNRPKSVLLGAVVALVAAAAAGASVTKEYFLYDDLRPQSQLAQNLRYVESIHGGTVPMAIFIEPKEGRAEGAMLEPAAVALIDRITQRLEADFPAEVKNASSISKYLRKVHRLFAGDEVADREPLPRSRAAAAQELTLFDDPRMLRDVLSFDRSTAAIYATVPDFGSSKMTGMIDKLNAYFAQEEAKLPYDITITGIFGVGDGIYINMVGGLTRSLGLAVLISFAIFFLVLRSWRLALIALVPNVLPLLMTLGVMSLLRIDVKPSTVIIFSITLVIADDDTIQFFSRFRTRFLELVKSGAADPHRIATLETLRSTGVPMCITALAVTLGFLVLLLSHFLGVANLGLLTGVSLLAAVLADLFLSPLILIHLKPKIADFVSKTVLDKAAEAPRKVA